MRTAFINELVIQAETDSSLFLVVGDLGYSVVEPFANQFPDRFLNAGVAEQNMTTVAAGLASEGYHVFTYSIANFSTLRCLEQIRNDICYHNLSVTVVAVGGGVAYGNLGYSHHAVQDIAALRSMPNMTVLSPADPGEAAGCVRYAIDKRRPSYLRLGKAGEKILHPTQLISNGPILVREGTADLAIAATGVVLRSALAAADSIAARGIEVAVFSCPVISSANAATFTRLWSYRRLLSVEEHGLAGGFGSFLKEIAPDDVSIQICSIPDANAAIVGSQELLWRKAGIDSASLVERALNLLS